MPHTLKYKSHKSEKWWKRFKSEHFAGAINPWGKVYNDLGHGSYGFIGGDTFMCYIRQFDFEFDF